MIAKTSKYRTRELRDDYFSLVREFPLKPISTIEQHDRAMEMVRRLAVPDEGSLSPGEQDYLDTLMVLLEDFDRSQRAWKRVSGADLLRHLVAESGMSTADLGIIVGSRPLASLILSGKREISKDVMRRLGRHFHLDPGAFL